MRVALVVAALCVQLSCAQPPSADSAARWDDACIVGARYEARSDASFRTYEFLARRFIDGSMLEEGEFTRESIMAVALGGRGDGKFAVRFGDSCADGGPFVLQRLAELQRQTDDRSVRAQLRLISDDLRPITFDQYESGQW